MTTENRGSLIIRASAFYLFSILFVSLLVFIPAGTVKFMNGWLFISALFIPMLFALAYLLAKDPALLAKRMKTREKEKPQKIYLALSIIICLATFALPGLDFRFGWSEVTEPVVIIATITMLSGYLIFFIVMRQNSYASRVIEIQDEQKLIDTGLYSLIRHPMYSGATLLYLSAPLVLGSYYALIPAIAIPVLLIIRILNEEKVLAKGLKGYTDYMKKVRYRLIPFVWIIVVPLILLVPSCKNNQMKRSDKAILEAAQKICQSNLILDSHIDWPDFILSNPEDISGLTANGDFDFVRAGKGGLNAVLSVMYVNSEYDVDKGRAVVDTMLNLVDHYTVTYPDKFATARNPGDVERNFENNLLSLPVCLENGSPIGNDLGYLMYLKEKGVVYITLTHNRANQISDSNFDPDRKWNGLSPFGQQVIGEMNRLGIMIDISHSTDSAVFQALRYSRAPIAATHSSCRYFTPGLERNLSDTLIRAIAAKNGVIMVNFGAMFIDSVCLNNTNDILDTLAKKGLSYDSKEGSELIQEFAQTHRLLSDSKQLVDHIEHIIKVAGIDHVGLGSDFDGIGPSKPEDVTDVSGYPVIVSELLWRGYKEEEIKKILSGNFLRVWNEVIATAASLSDAPK